MERQNVFKITYIRNGSERVHYARSIEEKNKDLQYIREHDTLVSCKKCYPINMEKNQHNFLLVYNICFNIMSDMDDGDIPFDGEKYDELYERREKAEEFMNSYGMFNSQISWFTWNEYKEAKEMIAFACMHRDMANNY